MDELDKTRASGEEIRRNRARAFVLASAIVISILSIIYGVIQKQEADEHRLKTMEAQSKAEQAYQMSEESRLMAEHQRIEAERQRAIAEENMKKAMEALKNCKGNKK